MAQLPPGLTDPEKHCVSSAGIAQQCSTFEAWVAAWGKEARDVVGHGDASLADLRADHLGRQCAASVDGLQTRVECCRSALATPRESR